MDVLALFVRYIDESHVKKLDKHDVFDLSYIFTYFARAYRGIAGVYDGDAELFSPFTSAVKIRFPDSYGSQNPILILARFLGAQRNDTKLIMDFIKTEVGIKNTEPVYAGGFVYFDDKFIKRLKYIQARPGMCLIKEELSHFYELLNIYRFILVEYFEQNSVFINIILSYYDEMVPEVGLALTRFDDINYLEDQYPNVIPRQIDKLLELIGRAVHHT